MNRLLFAFSLFIAFALFVYAISNSQGATGSLPQEVAVGYALWREYGCESCHTLFGQGGNYAPDLTHIYTLRGETYIREFMVNPSAWHPNQRLMPRFTITQAEIGSVIALLRWTSEESPIAESWPPNPIQVAGSGSLVVAEASEQEVINDPIALQGREIYSQRCAACHTLAEGVILVGPSFYGIANRAGNTIPGVSAEDYIRDSILFPSDYLVPGFDDLMQKNFSQVLNSDEVTALIAYLMTFTEGE